MDASCLGQVYALFVVVSLFMFLPRAISIAKQDGYFSLWDVMMVFLIILIAPISVSVRACDFICNEFQTHFSGLCERMQKINVWKAVAVEPEL